MSTDDLTPDDVRRLVSTDLITLDDPPAEKRAAIEFLLDQAVEADRVADRETALDDLLAREEETTTGVGKGIAIPHAKTAAVERPSVAFAHSPTGIDFDSMDDQPAHLLFMLLMPADGDDEHLSVLSSLSRSLMRDEVRDDLSSADSPETVQRVLVEAMT
jgi:PTS system fructose-specific IIA component